MKNFRRYLSLALFLCVAYSPILLATEVEEQWRLKVGQGAYGKAGASFEEINAVHKQSSNVCQLALNLVKAQDKSNADDLFNLSTFVKLSSVSNETIIQVINKDINLIKEAINKKAKIPIYLSTSLLRLTELGDGTPWYLPRAIELLNKYPNMSQGVLPNIELFNNDYPVWRAALYYCACLHADSTELKQSFEELVKGLRGFYKTEVPEALSELLTKTHLYLNGQFNIPTGFYVFGGNQTNGEEHIGDCSSMISQILLHGGKNPDYFMKNRTSTLYLELAHDAMMDPGQTLTGGRILTEAEKNRLATESLKPEVTNLTQVLSPILNLDEIQAGDILLHSKTNISNVPVDKQLSGPRHVVIVGHFDPDQMPGHIISIELNRMDNPKDSNFIEGYGYRKMPVNRPSDTGSVWQTRLLRIK